MSYHTVFSVSSVDGGGIIKTHLRCISSILIHYNCKFDADIQDVYHRLNFERALKKLEARIIMCLILHPKQWPDFFLKSDVVFEQHNKFGMIS